MCIVRPTLALRSALPLFSVLLVSGCSQLPRAADTQEDEATPAAASSAFDLEIQAPDTVRPLLERHLELQRFRALPDLHGDELQRLVDAAPADARELLGTLGFFSPTVRIDWQAATAVPPRPDALVIEVDPGPPTRVTRADVQFASPDGALFAAADLPRPLRRVQRDWGLAVGETFTQAAWDDAKHKGLRALQARRYPTARIEYSRAEIDADANGAALAVTYAPGPAYRFGPLRIEGSEHYNPEALRHLALLPTGEDYDEAELLDAQQRLVASGYYDAVFLRLDTEGGDPQAVPVVAQVREAPRQKLVFGVGASTDSGPRLSLDHTHNQMPPLGWRALSKLSLDRKTQLIGTHWIDLPNQDGWRWTGAAQWQRQETGALDVNSASLTAGRTQAGRDIDRTTYLQYDASRAQGEGAPADATALSLNYGWTGRYFNSDIAPTRGWGLAAELGAGMTLHPQRDPFWRALLRWQSFVPAGQVQADNGRTRSARLALRAELGAALARENADIPLNLLFLTGGDTTVRGYAYRSIGARTDSNQLYGGRYLAVGSVEWQRPIVHQGAFTDWESAVFIDAGAVSDHPETLTPRVGVGAGLRWRSPVGPLQADLAFGMHDRQLRLHLRMGFSF